MLTINEVLTSVIFNTMPYIYDGKGQTVTELLNRAYSYGSVSAINFVFLKHLNRLSSYMYRPPNLLEYLGFNYKLPRWLIKVNRISPTIRRSPANLSYQQPKKRYSNYLCRRQMPYRIISYKKYYTDTKLHEPYHPRNKLRKKQHIKFRYIEP